MTFGVHGVSVMTEGGHLHCVRNRGLLLRNVNRVTWVLLLFIYQLTSADASYERPEFRLKLKDRKQAAEDFWSFVDPSRRTLQLELRQRASARCASWSWFLRLHVKLVLPISFSTKTSANNISAQRPPLFISRARSSPQALQFWDFYVTIIVSVEGRGGFAKLSESSDY